MIGYVTLGTNDLERAGEFYDGIAGILGMVRVMQADRSIMWGPPGGGPMLSLIKPYDGKRATVGNGTMVGILAQNEDEVDRVHAYALAHGGSDEGAPGDRAPQFYGAYFRDPEGNKLVIYHFRPV